MAKKVIPIVICILILGALGCFIGLNWNGFKVMLSGAKIYTHEQIEESYDKGYNDANTNEKEYLSQLDYYKALTEDKEIEILNLTSQINNLTNDNQDYENQLASLTTLKNDLELQVKNLQDTNSLNEKTIAELNSQKSDLQTQVNELTTNKQQNEARIQELENQISSLNSQIEELQNTNNGLNSQISDLNNQITALNNEIDILENDNANKDSQISSLNTQIANLEDLNSQLEDTNNAQLQTIENLNSQVDTLNARIFDLSNQIANNQSNVDVLNKRIQDLESSIAYYEEYIENLETEQEVYATFMFDGSVYEVQKVDKNSTLTIENPTSTETIIFNGWLVDGEPVDLSTYTIITNTTFVADITYKYLVQFMVNGEVVSNSYVVENEFATAPTNITLDGYEIESWNVDNAPIDLATYSITKDTTFVAKIVKVHTITLISALDDGMSFDFKAEDGQMPRLESFQDRDGWSVSTIQPELDIISEAQYGFSGAIKFVGWTNTTTGEVVDNPLAITYYNDATYTSSLETFSHLVFLVNIDDEEPYYDYYISHNGGIAYTPENPVKENYEFLGWAMIEDPDTVGPIDGIQFVPEIPIMEQVFVAVFEASPVVEFKVDSETISTQIVQKNNYATLPTEPTKDGYVFAGWSINGADIIDIATYTITADTTFIAVFNKLVGFQTDSFVSVRSLDNVPFESASCLTTSTEYGYSYIYNNSQNLISRYSFESNTYDEPITFISRIDDGSYYYELVNKDILIYSYNNNFYLVDFANSSCKQIASFTSYDSNKSSGFRTAFLSENKLFIVYKSSSSQSNYNFRYYDLDLNTLSEEFTQISTSGSIFAFEFINNTFLTYTYNSSNFIQVFGKNIVDSSTLTLYLNLSSFETSSSWNLNYTTFDNSILSINISSYYNIFNLELDFINKTLTLIDSEERADSNYVVNAISVFEYNGVKYYTKSYDFGYYNENGEQVSINNELAFSRSYILLEDRVVLIQNNVISSFIVYYFA